MVKDEANMSHHDVRILLDLGRKAGLRTDELYKALNGRPPAPGELPPRQADPNGYVEQVDREGRRIYQPQPPER